MAGRIGSHRPHGRKRVFVLVDNGITQGVFTSWDAAESYADEHRLSLDHLMEYETLREDPDHLHLMAVLWEDSWKFHGQWSRQSPDWPYPPKKIRLDHYHRRENKFHLFRQKEFDWETGILMKINPMAPDQALDPTVAPKKPVQNEEWRPKLTPLKPIGRKEEPPKPVLEPEIEPFIEEPETKEAPAPVEPPQKPQPKPTLAPRQEPGTPIKPMEEPATQGTPPAGKISFQKKSPLRLKSKGVPQPIPSFKATMVSPGADPHTGKSTVEMAHSDLHEQKTIEEKARVAAAKPRRIWSLRFILTVAAVVVCWAGGIYWVLKPEPTASNVISEITSLASARTIVCEPDMVFFQLEVDPIHQERWIQSLGLEPVPQERGLTIPTYHALSNWEKPDKFIRPPYALVEIDEWWALRSRNIQYGFSYEWEDGSIVILDLESDLMIGWAQARKLPDLLN